MLFLAVRSDVKCSTPLVRELGSAFATLSELLGVEIRSFIGRAQHDLEVSHLFCQSVVDAKHASLIDIPTR
jgi:hypothetical protein